MALGGGLMVATLLTAVVLQLAASVVRDGGSVRGTVRSDATGAPIAGARVEADARGHAMISATSDSLGGYELRDVGGGQHRLRFIARGYDTLSVDVLVASDASLHLDVA